MATISKVLFRGAATTTTTTTLYTVPSATTTVVTDIMVSNTSGSSVNFTMSLDNIAIATNVNVNGNDTTVIPCKQVLDATKTIKGGASSTSINFSISGVEIS
jgi:hypothetical protein